MAGCQTCTPDGVFAMEILFTYWPVAIGFVGLLWHLLTRVGGEQQFPYHKKPAIMTRNEQEFYRALLCSAGDRYDVFAMVRIADLLSVEPTPKRISWQNRINCKHVDFVLCDMETQEALLAIEVDDRSHQQQSRQDRDYFVDRAFAAAGLPLLRIQATRNYSAKELRKAIDAEMNAKPSKKLASERRVKVG